MLITKTFKHCISKRYHHEECRDVYSRYGERLAVIEFDECGSTLSLSVHDPQIATGSNLIPINNAALESWNDNVLKFGGYCRSRWTNVYIELDPQDGNIKRVTVGDPNGIGTILTNE